MKPLYTFETDYHLDTLSAMARAVRKTVGRKRNRKSRIFGIFSAILGLIGAFFGERSLISLGAAVFIIVVMIFEDRINGYAARKKLLPGTEHCRASFYENYFLSETGAAKSEWAYDKIAATAENGTYFIFVFSRIYSQAFDLRHIDGGTADEFRKFIEEKTGKKSVSFR